MTLLSNGEKDKPHKHLEKITDLTGRPVAEDSYELDAIARCDCGKFFFWGWVNVEPMPYQAWIQVRFWNFRIKRMMEREGLIRNV